LLPHGIILSPFLLWNAWRDQKEQLAEQKRRILEKKRLRDQQILNWSDSTAERRQI
jgi:hypothetical protein